MLGCTDGGNRQYDFSVSRKEFANFFSRLAVEQRQTPRLKKRGKLANSIFFRTQLTLPYVITSATEFANPGKLTWQTGKLIFPDQALAVY